MPAHGHKLAISANIVDTHNKIPPKIKILSFPACFRPLFWADC